MAQRHGHLLAPQSLGERLRARQDENTRFEAQAAHRRRETTTKAISVKCEHEQTSSRNMLQATICTFSEDMHLMMNAERHIKECPQERHTDDERAIERKTHMRLSWPPELQSGPSFKNTNSTQCASSPFERLCCA
eukprot:3669596-Pleurochrysis_carterae.AAC.7